ncbi:MULTISPECIES: YggS family pyridoxal phosphate-dependent enzyme [Halocynthiibacter]|uniref:Pyridoxal phosphate homeostasis protein n=1 Tax=Halocynthiibacter halioticoli TaxID=2986804 RepID=A0AAE3LRK9_9RHOB|nr:MULTISPECIES: YggS family pyridoxal phosphate-dependent enzyme [Halocynthiibacter]MCV6825702.1 YggS family pyridoxal phosphate-dependent enzyme [Halocynthiibacter halioticoli]MCW4058703.1 YggS family pyridoxal phosphate-dependent enzyme [Halocynthiibacter sp. SDUM655004]
MSLADIQSRITSAEQQAGRKAGSTKLIAVSKVQPNENVRSVLEQGHKLFGENKVQEAAGKWPKFREQFEQVNVHLLGPLQTNKARQAMGLFEAIHSLDRPKLANTLARLAQELGNCPDLFIQVNTGEEAQKSGVSVSDADQFIADCRELGLPVVGLMCLPPAQEDPAPHFRSLRAIAEQNGLENLSMGMSADFEIAIQEGATHVRVGSAIFGARDYSGQAR